MWLFDFLKKKSELNNKETKLAETVNLSESNNKEFNSIKDEVIQNVLSEDIDLEQKPAIDDEQYRNFAESAAQRVIKETEIPCMFIHLEDEATSIFDSKVGGLPYIPKDFDVPLDYNGNQMKLLAQIHCNDIKELKDYPHEGILQFWMTTTWPWEEAKVIYHKEVDRTITGEVIQKIDKFKEDNKHSFPVTGSYRMKFTLSEESISCCDYRLKALFCQYFTEISGEYISDPEDTESEEVYKVFVSVCEERDDAFGNSHKVGGYRYSTQFGSWDYDDYKEGEKIDINSDDADVLLFQLKSDYALINFETRTHDWIKVMWGDAGVGRFSIKRSDLKKCDFDNAWFSWDCS